jgi:hypothetical protein
MSAISEQRVEMGGEEDQHGHAAQDIQHVESCEDLVGSCTEAGTVIQPGSLTGANSKEGGSTPAICGTDATAATEADDKDLIVPTGTENPSAANDNGHLSLNGGVESLQAAADGGASTTAVVGEAGTSGGQGGEGSPSLEACILPLQKSMKQGHFMKYLEDLGIIVATARCAFSLLLYKDGSN